MDETFWLPAGYSWKDLDAGRARGLNIPHVSDLRYVAIITICVSIVRYTLEYFVFRPIGKKVLANRPAEVESQAPHAKLPALYKSVVGRRMGAADYKRFAEETDSPLGKVTEWCKALTEAHELVNDGSKWTETCWRLLMYSSLCVTCWVICWPKDWLWNTRLCWRGYPYISIEPELQWLYLVELSMYLPSLHLISIFANSFSILNLFCNSYCNMLFSQFFDVKRGDFWAMLLHHLATIGLILFSYLCNYVRAGTLVLLCHDISDLFLEGAKLFKYAGKQTLADVGFGFFAGTWFLFRLVLLPFYVLHGSWYHALEEVGRYRSMVFLHGLVGVLLILHVWWFSLICRIIYTKLVLNREVCFVCVRLCSSFLEFSESVIHVFDLFFVSVR
jgi:hypothetical protein